MTIEGATGAWSRVEALFNGAVERGPTDRVTWLQAACGGDDDLYAQVAALLVAHETDGPLDGPLAEILPGPDDLPAPPDLSGLEVEGFTVVRPIGAGGMATVYEAMQDLPRRRVALKLLWAGASSDANRRRFEREADILGRLRHAAIAEVYAAGIHAVPPREVPYLAMELVDGRHIDEFVRDAAPPLTVLLRLFLEVCEGVQHAHSRGVIHRDLKPANILVDSAGRPKILDFGIARAIEGGPTAISVTAEGMVVGTIRYMSPEQARGGGDDVDVRTDIHALGTMLCELICGRHPLLDEGASIPEALEAILHREPDLFVTMGDRCPEDLRRVIGKAIERDPLRRYQSVAEYAADLRRFLEHEPVLARRPTVSYLLARFICRHRVLVGAALLVLLAIAGGVIGIALALVRAERSERAAADEARTLAEINGVLNSLWESPRPTVLGRDVRVLDVLDRWVAQLDQARAAPAPVEAALRTTAGMTYLALGETAAARRQVDRAGALTRRDLPPDDATALRARRAVAMVDHAEGRYVEARTELEQLVGPFTRRFGASDAETLRTRTALVAVLQSQLRHTDAERELRAILSVTGTESGACAEDVLARRVMLAEVLRQSAQREDAYTEASSVWQSSRATLGEASLVTIQAARVLGATLIELAREGEAEEVLRPASAAARSGLGDRNPATLDVLAWLATAQLGDGHADEAMTNCRQVVELATASGLDGQHGALLALLNLGVVLHARGHVAEANGFYDRALAILRAGHGANDLTEARLLVCLAMARRDREDYQTAEVLATDALRVLRRMNAPLDSTFVKAMHTLATIAKRTGDLERAAALAREANDAALAFMGERDPFTIRNMSLIASIDADRGHLTDAEAEMTRVIELSDESLDPAEYETAPFRFERAEIIRMQGRVSEAEPELARAVAWVRSNPDVAMGSLALYLWRHAQALLALDRTDEAERLLLEAEAVGASAADREPATFVVGRVRRALADLCDRRADAEEAVRYRRLAVEADRRSAPLTRTTSRPAH